MSGDIFAVRTLFEQLHVFRAHVDNIDPSAKEGPDLPGSGIDVLIPEFDLLLRRTRKVLSDNRILVKSVAHIRRVEEIEWRPLDASYPRAIQNAKQQLLLRTNLLLQAVGQFLQSLHLSSEWEALLHDVVRTNALKQFKDQHWRDAALNAFVAIFDLLRSRTSLDLDGEALITRTLSLDRPLLSVADLSTDSGRNDQIGFMMVLQGVYRGVRNPKAHTLQHDLTALKAAQYLVMASLLARRIDEATQATEQERRPRSGDESN